MVKPPKTLAEWFALIAALSASLATLAGAGLGMGEYVRRVANDVYDARQEQETRMGTLQYLMKDCRERIMLPEERERLREQIRRAAAEIGVQVNLETCNLRG